MANKIIKNEMIGVQKIYEENECQELMNLFKRAKKIQKITSIKKDQKRIKIGKTVKFLAALLAALVISAMLLIPISVITSNLIIGIIGFSIIGTLSIGSWIGIKIISLYEYTNNVKSKNELKKFIKKMEKEKENFPENKEENTKIETITEQESLFLYFKHKGSLLFEEFEHKVSKNYVTMKYDIKLNDLNNKLNGSETLEDLKKFFQDLFKFTNEFLNAEDEAILKLKNNISEVINQITHAINKLNVNKSGMGSKQKEQQQDAIPIQDKEIVNLSKPENNLS